MEFTKEELITLKEALECYCAETEETEEDSALLSKLDKAINKK